MKKETFDLLPSSSEKNYNQALKLINKKFCYTLRSEVTSQLCNFCVGFPSSKLYVGCQNFYLPRVFAVASHFNATKEKN